MTPPLDLFPAGSRDYLAGSRVVALFRKSAEWLFQKTAQLSRKVVSWMGVEGSFRQTVPPRTLCAILAAAIAANGLALFLFRKEIALWGVVFRGAGLGVALLGLRGSCDWGSVQESSILMRFLRKGK